MKKTARKLFIITALVMISTMWAGEVYLPFIGTKANTANAVVGRPATPISYAGVARRTPVGPGVNTRYNRGGPVNRVGRR